MFKSPLRKNLAYKGVLTISNYIIGFVTFPYISRVFGVETLGLINFVDNTTNYFLLFATMGIGMLGVREIAAVKNNPSERDKVFSNILGLNLCFTVATLCIYLLVVALVPKLSQYAELFYIGAAKILFSAFLVEWFFTGIEDFKYITLRSVAVKTAYVIAVFVFVRQKEDYVLYFLLTIGIVVINSIINLLHVRQHINIICSELLKTRYLKSNISLGIYSIMTSMYLTFNVMYLGLVSDNTQVGYYTTAFKLYTVVLGLFNAFCNIMLPRMSALLAEGDYNRYHILLQKSFSLIARFSIPMIVGGIILAPQVIYLLSGPGYEGAILPMRIIIPAILLVCIAFVVVLQILIPMKRDKILLTASICGATTSIIINIFIVPHLQSIGSAIVLICAELAVTSTHVIYIIRKRITTIPFVEFGREFLYSIPIMATCIAISRTVENVYMCLFLATIISAAIWAITNKLRYNKFY